MKVALFKNILRLLPETQTIALISGNSPNARFWVNEQKRILGPLLGNKVRLIFFYEQPFEEILKEIAKLPPHSAIFFQMLLVEGASAMSGDKEPLKRIDQVGTAPIFSYDETFFTGAVVGGPMFSSAGVARPTAAAAVRMLGGERASSIEVPVIGFSAPKYDWRQLQRWTISESRLPPESCFGSQLCGSAIRGKSRSSPPLFSCRPCLSRSCCASIVGVNSPKCSPGSAWRNLPMSTASRPLAN